MKGTAITTITLAILYLTTPSVLSSPIGRRDTPVSLPDLNGIISSVPVDTPNPGTKRAPPVPPVSLPDLNGIIPSVPVDTPNPGIKRDIGADVNPGVRLGTTVGSSKPVNVAPKPNAKVGTKRDGKKRLVDTNIGVDALNANTGVVQPSNKRNVNVDANSSGLNAKVDGNNKRDIDINANPSGFNANVSGTKPNNKRDININENPSGLNAKVDGVKANNKRDIEVNATPSGLNAKVGNTKSTKRKVNVNANADVVNAKVNN